MTTLTSDARDCMVLNVSWTGDFANPWLPGPQIVPGHVFGPYVPYQPEPPVYDPIVPNGGSNSVVTLYQSNPWNVQFQVASVVARCDVPGAVLDSLNVEVTNGSVYVSYRFDTDGVCSPPACRVGTHGRRRRPSNRAC